MKLATFTHQGRTAIGVVTDEEIAELDGAPVGMRALLAAGEEGRALAARAMDRGGPRLRLAEVKLEAPVPDPRKFLGLGGNYKAHVAEILARRPDFPVSDRQTWFNKQVTCVTGPYDPIHKPKVSDSFDYEGEMAIVIGRRCRHVKAADAEPAIAGYMVCNDASVREWQSRAPTMMLGKSFDTHGPTGPWLTLGLSIEEAEDLEVRTWVNGELRQQGRTSDFVHGIGAMIEELSAVFTLEPGDILATGTPSGVGAAMTPPRFLRAGDLVRIEIERLGAIENPVILEPEPS